VVPVRGNLNTRLRKLEQGDEYDALVLALAGVRRLGWEARVDQLLDTEELCLHAVGQGALAVTGRAGAGTPPRLRELLARAVHHPATAACCLAERALLRELGGGCSVPLGVASACLEQERIRLRARLLDPEGREALQAELESHPGESSEELARRLAEELRQRGADRLLAAATSTATATAPAAQNQQPQSHSSAHPSSV
jgi:hydroxymethylbilane synthase